MNPINRIKRKTKSHIAKARADWRRNFYDLYSFKPPMLLRPGTRSAMLSKPIAIFWEAGLGKSKTIAPPLQVASYRQALGRIHRNNSTTA